MMSGTLVEETLALVQHAVSIVRAVNGGDQQSQSKQTKLKLDAELLSELEQARCVFDESAGLIQNCLSMFDPLVAGAHAKASRDPDLDRREAGTKSWEELFTQSCKATEAWLDLYSEFSPALVTSPLADVRGRISSVEQATSPTMQEIEARKADVEYFRALLSGAKRFPSGHDDFMPFECLIISEFANDLLQLYLREQEFYLLEKKVSNWISAIDRLCLREEAKGDESRNSFDDTVCRVAGVQANLLDRISMVSSSIASLEVKLDREISELQHRCATDPD